MPPKEKKLGKKFQKITDKKTVHSPSAKTLEKLNIISQYPEVKHLLEAKTESLSTKPQKPSSFLLLRRWLGT